MFFDCFNGKCQFKLPFISQVCLLVILVLKVNGQGIPVPDNAQLRQQNYEQMMFIHFGADLYQFWFSNLV